ncbi:recombination regulator RecX [Carnobacterium gallinarum]|uniref:recombination regulator RecX n=1 Tax=Carnobacterium gallinarum TaxID=2749 RepID=UPI00054FAEBF|nr:recombination regulator RecX [Carnobacterium gallinarum]
MPKEIKLEQFISKEDTTFPVITKIEVQKKAKERYNIYLNGEYAFPVDEAILVHYVLHKGMEISPEFRKELEEQDGFRKAYNRALNYLNYGLRSEKEVRDDLVKHEISLTTAQTVIDKLKEQNYINDLTYAESYTRTGANLGGKGPRVITQELKRRGLTDEVIANGLEQYPCDQMLENGIELAEKVLKRTARSSSRETKNKIQQNLMQKGFSSDLIQEVLQSIDTEKDEEDEYNALQDQGEKLWRKNSRLEPFKQIQKVKTSLFQKGFPSDLISQFITEKEMEEEDE